MASSLNNDMPCPATPYVLTEMLPDSHVNMEPLSQLHLLIPESLLPSPHLPNTL